MLFTQPCPDCRALEAFFGSIESIFKEFASSLHFRHRQPDRRLQKIALEIRGEAAPVNRSRSSNAFLISSPNRPASAAKPARRSLHRSHVTNAHELSDLS